MKKIEDRRRNRRNYLDRAAELLLMTIAAACVSWAARLLGLRD